MEPRIVEQANFPPGQCLFSSDLDGPFIDTGVKCPWASPYGYISVNYVEGLARDLLGMVSASKVEQLEEQLASYEERIAELQSFVQAAEAYQAIREQEAVA